MSKDKEERASGPTIVGGQPPRAKKVLKGVPVGVERVLLAAADDEAFRDELRRDRAAAVEGKGLRDSERAILQAIPEGQLFSMIDGIDTSETNLKRRSFMRVVAATAVTAAAGKALAGCGDDDAPPPDSKVPEPDGQVDRGIRPDLPDSGVDIDHDAMRATGIRPDGLSE